MKNILGLLVALSFLAGCENTAEKMETPDRPNILLIVADDLGYTDIGSYGGEIRTPNLNDLADNGLLLTNFYSAPTCSPTRAMLLSGTDHHLAGLGTMAGEWDTNQVGQRGYETYLNHDVVSVSSILQDNGYNTYMAGKWHLGALGIKGYQPQDQGFDEVLAYLIENGTLSQQESKQFQRHLLKDT